MVTLGYNTSTSDNEQKKKRKKSIYMSCLNLCMFLLGKEKTDHNASRQIPKKKALIFKQYTKISFTYLIYHE